MIKAVIVQARMTSTRLPGKVMLPLGDRTVLGEVLFRCSQIPGIDLVCCAIPEGPEHNQLFIEAEKYKAKIFRGSELDVLDRYYQAALKFGITTVMRITSDCPLLDPVLCGVILEEHLNNSEIYTCNNYPPSWPHGLDCEVFSFKDLETANLKAKQPEEREHVTPWIRKNLPIRNISNPKGNEYHVRITLDTQEDYINIKKALQSNEYI